MTAILGAIHREGVDAASWKALTDELPMSWLPLDFYEKPVGPTCYDDRNPEDTK